MGIDLTILQARKMRLFADELCEVQREIDEGDATLKSINAKYSSLRVRAMALSIMLQERALGLAKAEHHQLKLDLETGE